MEVNREKQKSDSFVHATQALFSKDDPMSVGYNNDNFDTSNNKVISESSTCDKQNTEELQENTSNSCFQDETDDTCSERVTGFKKPRALIVGPKRSKTGQIRRVVNDAAFLAPLPVNKEATKSTYQENSLERCKIDDESTSKSTAEENVTPDTKSIPVPYLEPFWGGKPKDEYKLEVLKSGVILETIDLTKNSFYAVGRLPSCNLSLAHPTISRYHAIIQYRVLEDETNSKGFYLYDLESTHGTFWNGHRIKPRCYVRLHGGHMIRFGCSQRKYILQAPPEDQEEESELSITQLKEKRLEMLREREIRQQEEQELEEEARNVEETDGIDWGMGEDADEETDLTENPYASMADEDLYLDDPKKTLRGWFEREGYDLQYQVEEKGIGQFLCWIILPRECFGGRSIKAEALVKGKKKESVVQCALEACRILDKHGLLRQANHESRKKKSRNWEEEDYYDSDEDNFLDRTGTVERKREQRMKLAGKCEEKVETYSSLTGKHGQVMNKILHLTNRLKEAQESNVKGAESNEDSLDVFMSSLNTNILSKSDVTKMKIELQNLRKEEARLVKLINLTKPANLPPLVSQVLIENKKDTHDPYQRAGLSTRKISQLERRRKLFATKNKDDSEKIMHLSILNNDIMGNEEEEEENDDDENNVKKEREVQICITEDNISGTNNTYKSECEEICKDKIESQDSLKIGDKLTYTSKNINQDMERNKHDANVEVDRKRKKDRRSGKALKSVKQHYDQDVYSEDYSTWLPPQNQTGDGRTSLNDKYGY